MGLGWTLRLAGSPTILTQSCFETHGKAPVPLPGVFLVVSLAAHVRGQAYNRGPVTTEALSIRLNMIILI